ncbi:MAG: adenylate/guanylate cyclase domain-containing protein [Spirochaetales bacterium]|jgi:class 3 adenylate cyclase|nr:adenylate/guanylate cyclase domain-containing protein [Spirochaetales bacterium]
MSNTKETLYIFTIATAKKIRDKYPDNPGYAAQCLEDIMEYFPPDSISPEDTAAIHQVIAELRVQEPTDPPPVHFKDAVLRQEILDFYVPKPLVKAILASGGIPKDSAITQIGVGFIDIADYSFLSKFLSPKENQILLNGLYSCFAEVLRRKGGYLNKIEGDSIMFHFGGLIDPNVRNMDRKEEFNYITTQLFHTCVEMQRLCYQFNNADENILDYLNDDEEKNSVRDAFGIIHFMRNDDVMANIFNALFQIRIRIGANVGEVSIGNFGPPGSKHWDIIGNPVIEAKRMESTSPIGGLRISESFYKALERNGIVADYYDNFLSEAKKLNGYFRDIKKEEVFQFGSVLLKDKKNVSFQTYSVQVNPGLPESIIEQMSLLLEKGETGADRIVDLIMYYRGNKHVIDAIEELFTERDIRLRKGKMVFYLFPEKFQASLRIMGGNRAKVEEFVEQKYKLFDVLKTLGGYQDRLKLNFFSEDPVSFTNYEQYMETQLKKINENYKRSIKNSIHNTYFFNVIFPLIFKGVKASILEYQAVFQHQRLEAEAEKGAALLGSFGGELDMLKNMQSAKVEDADAEEVLEDLEDVEDAEEVESV